MNKPLAALLALLLLFAGSRPEIKLSAKKHPEDGTFYLRVNRTGMHPIVCGADTIVVGDIPVTIFEAVPAQDPKTDQPLRTGLVSGTGYGGAKYTFSCERAMGGGGWSVRFEVSGIFQRAPACTLVLSVTETYLPGGNWWSQIRGAGYYSGITTQKTVKVFRNLKFPLLAPTVRQTQIEGQKEGAVHWKNTWQVYQVNLPPESQCEVEVRSYLHDYTP